MDDMDGMAGMDGVNLVDLAFVVDTTGSMGGLIAAAQRHMIRMVEKLVRSAGRPRGGRPVDDCRLSRYAKGKDAMARVPTGCVDARALVARLSREAQALQGREILAPLLPGGRIRTRLGGLVYEFRPQSPFVGWGHFRPLDERTAEPVGEALPWERAAYQELFPLLRVVLLWPHPAGGAGGTWWALPYNGSDVRQRFGLDPFEPLPVRLCDPTDGAERFARVLARVDGRTLLFDGPDSLADPAHAEWLRDALAVAEAPERFRPGLAASERHALLLAQMRALELTNRAEETPAAIRRAAASDAAGRERNPRRQRERLHRVAGTARLERRLRRALEKADATLLGYSETTNPDGTPAGIVVEWSDNGVRHRYRSVLDPGLDVVSSGICLSGRDGDFDLTSLVSVMAAAPGWSR